jgi:hypothetical protein
LISSVTESKNATTQARLAKREERPTGTDEAIERPPTGKVRSTGAVKKAERAKALVTKLFLGGPLYELKSYMQTAAKTAIAEKARAKKRKRKNEDERTAVEQEKTGQKRVGFA